MEHRSQTALCCNSFSGVAQSSDQSNRPTTRDRAELAAELRSFHIRNARSADSDANVGRPVHVLYYRALATDLVQIVRVLHERMEPSLHLNSDDAD